MKGKTKYALVLAGGGAKGAYQIGAWRAFRELGIEFEAVSGASVGALNAALIAQGNFKRAEQLWDGISLDKIVCIPPELLAQGQLYLRKGSIKYLKELNKSILKYGGLDSTPLLNLIKSVLDEKTIRKRGIDLGLITFNVGKMKPVELFLDGIKEGKLADYLLASASFPAFKRTTIDGNKYTDGGIYDNIPYRMIKNRGYKNIIVVDISGAGRNRRPDIVGTRTTYIKNSFDFGGILNFNPDILKRLRTLGYLDTMKTFGERKGLKYFFSGGRKTEEKLEKIIEPHKEELRALLPADKRCNTDLVSVLVDCSAASLGIEPIKDYSLDELLEEIRNAYRRIKNSHYKESRRHFIRFYKGLVSKWADLYGKRELSKYPSYEYYHAIKEFLSEKQARAVYPALDSFFPDLPAVLKFMEITDGKF